jgi:hypothetical protein
MFPLLVPILSSKLAESRITLYPLACRDTNVPSVQIFTCISTASSYRRRYLRRRHVSSFLLLLHWFRW